MTMVRYKFVMIGNAYVKEYNVDLDTGEIDVTITNKIDKAMNLDPTEAVTLAMAFKGEVIDGYPN